MPPKTDPDIRAVLFVDGKGSLFERNWFPSLLESGRRAFVSKPGSRGKKHKTPIGGNSAKKWQESHIRA